MGKPKRPSRPVQSGPTWYEDYWYPDDRARMAREVWLGRKPWMVHQRTPRSARETALYAAALVALAVCVLLSSISWKL
jgi:hypothetical protein